jgi:general secretion pathway protein G
MSLIEIVVVIAIITMLMSAVGVYALGQLREARITTAKNELKTLQNALDSYFAIAGRYPDVQQGFTPLLERRVLRDPPVDPWGNPFRYSLVNGVPVVSTLGADGLEGGADDAADLSTAAR